MGFLIKQGHYKTTDAGLLYKSLAAVRLFELASKAQDAENLTFEEGMEVAELEKLADEYRTEDE